MSDAKCYVLQPASPYLISSGPSLGAGTLGGAGALGGAGTRVSLGPRGAPVSGGTPVSLAALLPFIACFAWGAGSEGRDKMKKINI